MFLDVDGVLHGLDPATYRPRHATLDALLTRAEHEDSAAAAAAACDDDVGEVVPGEFEPACMTQLARLLASLPPPVRIVLSSTWRETARGRNAVATQIARHCPRAPALTDSTPLLPGRGRAAEIRTWLQRNRIDSAADGISGAALRWIALDDEDLSAPQGWRTASDDDDAAVPVDASPLPLTHFLRVTAADGLTASDVDAALGLVAAQQAACVPR